MPTVTAVVVSRTVEQWRVVCSDPDCPELDKRAMPWTQNRDRAHNNAVSHNDTYHRTTDPTCTCGPPDDAWDCDAHDDSAGAG